MWWECSECGGQVERARAPALCRECGTAGVIFVRADDDDAVDRPPPDGLLAEWLRFGLEQRRLLEASG